MQGIITVKPVLSRQRSLQRLNSPHAYMDRPATMSDRQGVKIRPPQGSPRAFRVDIDPSTPVHDRFIPRSPRPAKGIHLTSLGRLCLVISISILSLTATVFVVGFSFLHGGFFPTPAPPSVSFFLIIDAGSTGSRLHVFRFLPAYPMPRMQGPSDALKVNPGLSSYAGRPEAAGDSLMQLLRFAQEKVPTSAWATTPIFLMATAGLRLLDPIAQAGILESCRDLLESSPFRFEAEWAQVIGGAQEGMYGWLATNYAYGTLAHRDPRRTVGVFELGGASAQVTFASAPGDPDPPPSWRAEVDMGGGTHFVLYAHSFLNWGQEEAQAALAHALVREAAQGGANLGGVDLRGATPSLHAKLAMGVGSASGAGSGQGIGAAGLLGGGSLQVPSRGLRDDTQEEGGIGAALEVDGGDQNGNGGGREQLRGSADGALTGGSMGTAAGIASTGKDAANDLEGSAAEAGAAVSAAAAAVAAAVAAAGRMTAGGVGEREGVLGNPCNPRGYVDTGMLAHGTGTPAAVGTGDFGACHRVALRLMGLGDGASCPHKRCSIRGEVAPPLTGLPFLATENFHYTVQFLGLPASCSLAELAEAGERWCALPWAAMKAVRPDVGENELLRWVGRGHAWWI
eukprot:jgi/Mesvir1/25348/Mv18525-RA.2